jgi:hypothetical protein
MPKGTAVNLYVPKECVQTLDAIAEAMGKGEIGIRPTRSQLVTKAIENFINTCRSREELRQVIDAIEKVSRTEGASGRGRNKEPQRLRVIAPAS